MQYGFYEFLCNGVCIFGYGGSVDFFQLLMVFFFEQEFGLFVLFNMVGSSGGFFFRVFVDYYFFFSDQELMIIQLVDLLCYFGSFCMVCSLSVDLMKYFWFLELEVVQVDGVYLVIMGESRDWWILIGGNEFVQVGGLSCLIFLELDDGNISGYVWSEWVLVVYLCIFWFEQCLFYFLILLVIFFFSVFVVFVLFVLVWFGCKNQDEVWFLLLSCFCVWFVCIVMFVGGVLFVVGVLRVQEIVYGVSGLLCSVQWV